MEDDSSDRGSLGCRWSAAWIAGETHQLLATSRHSKPDALDGNLHVGSSRCGARLGSARLSTQKSLKARFLAGMPAFKLLLSCLLNRLGARFRLLLIYASVDELPMSVRLGYPARAITWCARCGRRCSRGVALLVEMQRSVVMWCRPRYSVAAAARVSVVRLRAVVFCSGQLGFAQEPIRVARTSLSRIVRCLRCPWSRSILVAINLPYVTSVLVIVVQQL